MVKVPLKILVVLRLRTQSLDDNSNMLKTPTATIKQVKDVITKNAGKADPMPTAPKYAEEAEADESKEVVAEEESTEATEETVDLNAAIEEDVNALLSGEDLSEEFKEKAKVILRHLSMLKSQISRIS